MLLILSAVLAGILTIGAPCILPLLPILLGASVGQKSSMRPLFITLGFIVMFSILGISLSFLTIHLHLNPNTLRTIAVVFLGIFGIFMIWPTPFEKRTSHMNRYINKANELGQAAGNGNFGGFVLGLV